MATVEVLDSGGFDLSRFCLCFPPEVAILSPGQSSSSSPPPIQYRFIRKDMRITAPIVLQPDAIGRRIIIFVLMMRVDESIPFFLTST